MNVQHYKYPRTAHLPWSPGADDDDIIIDTVDSFVGKEVVVTEKMDGECLDQDTIIYTNLGDMSIREICESDLQISVLSRNIITGLDEFRLVLNKFVKSGCDDWYEIELETGEVNTLTGNHRVWVENLGSYRRVIDLDGTEEIRLKK